MTNIYEYDNFNVEQKKSDYNGKIETYEILHRKKCVIILPYYNKKFILIKEYRIAIDKTILQFPAGKIELGEDMKCAARRELIEETGYKAIEGKLIGGFYSAPHFCDEYFYVYYMTDLAKSNKELTEKERIVNVYLSPGKIEEKIDNGEIIDAKTIVAFYYWKRGKYFEGN